MKSAQEVRSVTRPSAGRLVVRDDPRSFAAEAFRVLRTNLHYANPDNPLQRVMITSAGAGEGKSTTAANLAISLAQAERSVLLVDADLRRPVLHTMFRQPSVPGLSSYLAGDALPDAVVVKTSIPNLSLVACGPIPPNPSELLGSRRMNDFLRTMSERYDMIVLDSPPVLAVSDACVLVPAVDGVLLVVGSGIVVRPALKRAKEQLASVRARILGAVVNRFDAMANGYSKRYYDNYEGYYVKDARRS